jgi:hypothetical protein
MGSIASSNVAVQRSAVASGMEEVAQVRSWFPGVGDRQEHIGGRAVVLQVFCQADIE